MWCSLPLRPARQASCRGSRRVGRRRDTRRATRVRAKGWADGTTACVVDPRRHRHWLLDSPPLSNDASEPRVLSFGLGGEGVPELVRVDVADPGAPRNRLHVAADGVRVERASVVALDEAAGERWSMGGLGRPRTRVGGGPSHLRIGFPRSSPASPPARSSIWSHARRTPTRRQGWSRLRGARGSQHILTRTANPPILPLIQTGLSRITLGPASSARRSQCAGDSLR